MQSMQFKLASRAVPVRLTAMPRGEMEAEQETIEGATCTNTDASGSRRLKALGYLKARCGSSLVSRSMKVVL